MFGDVVGIRTGTVAQFAVIDSRVLAHKPPNLSHAQAAGAPLAGITALQCFESAGMKQRGSVLITGGAGGVGTYAIQIAKALYDAAHIVTTASAGAKTDLVKSLGAHRVMDYRDTSTYFVDVLKNESAAFDCVIDCTGEASKLAPLVKPGGGLVSILSAPTSEIIRTWMDGSIGPGVSVSPIISGSIWLLGSSLNYFTGAQSLISSLTRKNASFSHVITIPTGGLYIDSYA